MRDPDAVREMFSGITPRYDLLNRLLSAGLDRSWRRAAAGLLAPSPGDRVLDLCAGTGDLSLELARLGAAVVCADFSAPMLLRAERKFASGRRAEAIRRSRSRQARVEGRPRSVLADALKLPFRDGAFDGVAVAFGIRNLRTIDEGLAEMLRVLRPGGGASILEFSRPAGGPIAPLYSFYLRRLLPRIGNALSGRAGPYTYLAATIGEFPPPEAIAARMTACGFAAVRWHPLSGGIVAVHIGRRPAA